MVSDTDPIDCVQCLGNYATCDRCGEVYLAPGEGDALHRKASEVVRAREGLLSSAEIRTIRADLGLSQSGFEHLLGVGPKTVVRWEKGTVFQNRTTDTLLRLIRDMPAVRRRLLEGVAKTGFSMSFHKG
jgi:HTH-type transcriptional regulator/antitoxin MqsA